MLQMKAVIDIQKGWFEVAKVKQKIHFETYRPSELYSIEAESKRVISVPVRLKYGDFVINRTIVKKNMEISEGIYRAVSGQSWMEVTNYADSDQELFLEEPLDVVEFKTTQHFELNTIEGERKE